MTEFTKALRKALEQAIREFTDHGFDSTERLNEWMRRLRAIARQGEPRHAVIERKASAALESKFKRSISYAVAHKKHPGVSKFTLDRITPSLRPVLRQRIQASAQLIRLNHDEAIEKCLQRFSGWATSVPAGGSRVVNRTDVKAEVNKSLRQLEFSERRVLIDQGHKLMSSIDAVIAQQTGAIAGMWRSHYKQPGYNYREDHKERDSKVYVIRGSWAMENGYINVKDSAGYLDDMTQAGEEPFCRCYVVYLNNLRDLPKQMLTEKGLEALKKFDTSKTRARQ